MEYAQNFEIYEIGIPFFNTQVNVHRITTFIIKIRATLECISKQITNYISTCNKQRDGEKLCVIGRSKQE